MNVKKYFCLLSYALILTAKFYLTTGQNQNPTSVSPISFVQPNSCLPGYFDISHLACASCPLNSSSTDSKFKNFYFLKGLNIYFTLKINGNEKKV